MTSKKGKRTLKMMFWYWFLLITGIVLPAILTWILVALWWSLMLVHVLATIAVWAIYGCTWLVSLFFAKKSIPALFIASRDVKRFRPRLKITSCILLAVSVTTFFVFNVPRWESYDMFPHLSMVGDPTTTITVSWYTKSKTIGTVNYGDAPGNLNMSKSDAAPARSHALMLDSLSPNTTYYYQVEGFPSVWNFTTQTGTNEQLSIVAISDIHNQLYMPMIPDLLSLQPDFTFAVGDLVDFGGYPGMWNAFFNQISGIATSMPVMTAVGNHDTIFSPKASQYRNYLAMPMNSGNERYYNYTVNGIHFIVLDLEWGTETYSKEQKAWFEGVLDDISNSSWIVVLDHCPHYSSGAYNNATGKVNKLFNTAGNMISTFHDLFIQEDVDLVISGHDHHWEVANVDGIVYTIVGIANSRLDGYYGPKNLDSIYYEWEYSGFTEMTFNGNNCTIKGHLYDNGVEVKVDEYSFLK
ncbi:MAG: metallophosphoesterase [Promethearchaeota archaeon]